MTFQRSKEDTHICYDNCSNRGNCTSDLVCECSPDFVYKDCHLQAESLLVGEKKDYIVTGRQYFYFLAYQSSNDTFTTEFRESKLANPRLQPLPIRSLAVEFEALSGYGNIYLQPDNKKNIYLPNEDENEMSFSFDSKDLENSNSSFRDFPAELIQYKTVSRIIIMVEASNEPVSISLHLEQIDRGNFSHFLYRNDWKFWKFEGKQRARQASSF